MKYTQYIRLNYLLLLLLAGCSQFDFKTDSTGLTYKFIVENPTAIQPKPGDVITLQMRFTDAKGNMLEQTERFRTQLKKSSHTGGSIEDALAMMHKGDSAEFLISAADYYNHTLGIELPEKLGEDEKLHFYLKLLEVTAIEEFEKERRMEHLSGKHQEEKLLSDFLKRTNVTVEPTLSGLYFIELKQGNGKQPIPGKKATVHYLGYFIDGQLFDSSYQRKEPFSFTLGVGEVIPGWDEGVAKMKTGGKYKLIIPSYLAYGSEARGPIPPNSTLIFEIELISCE